MRLRQLFGWLTRRRLDTASATDATAPPEVPETVAQPVAASPELHSPASAAVPVLLSSSPPVIEVTATPSPLGPAVDSTAVFVQESSDTMIVAVPSAPTEIVRAQQAPPPDVTSTTLPSTAPVTAPPAVIAMHAVLVDGDPRTDWRGAGYFSRRSAFDRVLAAPRFKPPIEIVRSELDRFRRARPAALPPPAQPPPVSLAASTAVPLDFLPSLAVEPEHRRGFLPAIDPSLFTAFFFDRERPGSATDAYIRWPPILDAADRLLQTLVEGQDAAPPQRLSADGLYAAALNHIADPSSALLVCHNVTKAVARGSPALGIRRIDPDRAVWDFRGSRVARPQRLFYCLFDPVTFGSIDTGAWYRFFGIAAATAFAASRLLVRSPVTTTAAVVAQVDAVGRAMLIGEPDGAVAAAQAWANALAWCEWTLYAPSPETATTAIAGSSRAFCFGLRAAGVGAAGPVRWRVPAPDSALPDRRIDAPISVVELPPC